VCLVVVVRLVRTSAVAWGASSLRTSAIRARISDKPSNDGTHGIGTCLSMGGEVEISSALDESACFMSSNSNSTLEI